MDRTWRDPKPAQSIPAEVLHAAGGQPRVAEILVRRGITDGDSAKRFLDPACYTPASPLELPDMQNAVERIETAIARKEKICVWGDFDVDGQTATALLVSALGALGAEVIYYIPHRETEGHGIKNIARLDEKIDAGAVLILTCDTGIAEHAAITHAHSRGAEVIITDHHQLPPALPEDAYAAVNPQRLPESHPLRTLPGVGVAYKLVEALYDRAGRTAELPTFLDLVALGIVADVAVQVDDTRYLLQRGLEALRHTERPGLLHMLESAGTSREKINEETIGFVIGPRMNALGRLGDANEAVKLLTTQDDEQAQILANQLEGLNNERKLYTDQIFQAAQAQIEKDPDLLEKYAVLILANEKWRGGIVGIVANRLAETYNRPVILLVTSGEAAHGSARSVTGVDITAAIAEHADLLEHYGGHTMAAGLSLPVENIPKFRQMLSRTVKKIRGQSTVTPELAIDAFIPLAEITEGLVDAINKLAPFGPGNPPLTFATQKLTLKTHRQIGRTDDHLRLTIEDDAGILQDVVWWNADALPRGRFDLAYTLSINEYQGNRAAQMTYVDARPVDEEPQEFAHREAVEIVDWRGMNADERLDALRALDDKNAITWCEVLKIPDVETARRDALDHAQTLVIWTTPPCHEVLRAALARVNPGRVILVGADPGVDEQDAFLQRLARLAQYAINQKGGQAPLEAMAGAMAHREQTVKTGLELLAARGEIAFTLRADGTVHLAIPPGEKQDDTRLLHTLKSALEEAAAYRKHFHSATADTLIQT